jgi:CheY-like chemotaxis protein
LDLCSEPVLLRGLMDDIQAAWGGRAGQDGVTLLMSYEGDAELCVLSDKVRLRQVFDALIEPALIQTRSGSIEVSLKAEMVDGGVHLQGRVRDTGPGLPPELLAQIFESGLEHHVGGLGVVLARQIVLALNGSIQAESNVGAGVTMLFDFHCQAATAAAAPSEAVSTGAAHILVVDDNATNRMVAEALVEMFDCSSETASDGVEALEIARSGRFDVILMDIKMPRMDGMAATRAIRALAGAPGAVPIIALTANVDPEDARAYLACGMCAVVEKPIKPDRLLQAINDALASGAAQKQSAAA